MNALQNIMLDTLKTVSKTHDLSQIKLALRKLKTAKTKKTFPFDKTASKSDIEFHERQIEILEKAIKNRQSKK